MVALNTLWNLFVVVALGFFATSTSIDLAKEQPKKDSLVSESSRYEDEQDTEPVEVTEPKMIDTQGKTDTPQPPKYSVEWYLLPEPENRKELIAVLPWSLATSVPKNCKKRISLSLENLIKWYFSWRELQWFLLPKPENRAALRSMLPDDVAAFVPEDYRKGITSLVQRYIWHYFTLCAVDWYLLPKPENRGRLREELPSELAAKVPEDCNEPIAPLVENEIRKHFSVLQEKFRARNFIYSDA